MDKLSQIKYFYILKFGILKKFSYIYIIEITTKR